MQNIKFKKELSEELTKEQTIQRLENYCGYRERCEYEVKQKMYQLGVEQKDYDFYLDYLKANNFLDEDRFIAAFARGKFNIKNWGKRKIVDELKRRHIDEKRILPIVREIDEGIYFLRLQDVMEKKLKSIKEADSLKQRQKLIRFALQKGYEPDLIAEVLKTISF